MLDLSRVDGLTGIEDAGDKLKIGARVTHARIEDGEVPGATAYMQFVAAGISYRSVRTARSGVGRPFGPLADGPSALLALGGDVTAVDPRAADDLTRWIYRGTLHNRPERRDLPGFELPVLGVGAAGVIIR